MLTIFTVFQFNGKSFYHSNCILWCFSLLSGGQVEGELEGNELETIWGRWRLNWGTSKKFNGEVGRRGRIGTHNKEKADEGHNEGEAKNIKELWTKCKQKRKINSKTDSKRKAIFPHHKNEKKTHTRLFHKRCANIESKYEEINLAWNSHNKIYIFNITYRSLYELLSIGRIICRYCININFDCTASSLWWGCLRLCKYTSAQHPIHHNIKLSHWIKLIRVYRMHAI